MSEQAGKVRYGVVGGGWISQGYFMPGVARTTNSALTALVTGDPAKGRALGQRYGLAHVCGYADYAGFLRSGTADALYLALPNGMHREYTVPALEAGLHVLLEKPMAMGTAECRDIVAAAKSSGAKLMIAYRLHHEPGTLEAIRLVREGAIGDVLCFSSVFTQHVAASNHRAQQGYWAGPVPDMGTYPLNAARNLLGAEPIEVLAAGTRRRGLGFDDTVSVTLRFPGDRLAQFTVSYAADGMNGADFYHVVGTRGVLEMSPGFTLGDGLKLRLTVDGETTERSFPKLDQFAGETQYFSDCILQGREPEADGEEGLLDCRVLEAVRTALETGTLQRLEPFERERRPLPAQQVLIPAGEAPDLVNAAAPQEG